MIRYVKELDYSKPEMDSFHDMLVNAFAEFDMEINTTIPVDYQEWFDFLPDNIKECALINGLSDTVFRDNAYEFLVKMIEESLETEGKLL